MFKWSWICALIVAALAVGGATCHSSDNNTPQVTAEKLYGAVADRDTAEIMLLMCPEVKDQVSSGLLLGSAFLGLGGVFGLGTPHGKLRDMQYNVIAQTPT